MGSGSFPLDPKRDGKELKEIINKLQIFYGDWWGSVHSGDSGGGQFDNAASDGGYLEEIRIAIMLLEECCMAVKRCSHCNHWNESTKLQGFVCEKYQLETNKMMSCYQWEEKE